jgi:twitching motility protein PilU
VISLGQSLFDLFEKDLISYEDATRSADSENNLRLRIKLEGKAAKGQKDLGSTFEQVEF